MLGMLTLVPTRHEVLAETAVEAAGGGIVLHLDQAGHPARAIARVLRPDGDEVVVRLDRALGIAEVSA